MVKIFCVFWPGRRTLDATKCVQKTAQNRKMVVCLKMVAVAMACWIELMKMSTTILLRGGSGLGPNPTRAEDVSGFMY